MPRNSLQPLLQVFCEKFGSSSLQAATAKAINSCLLDSTDPLCRTLPDFLNLSDCEFCQSYQVLPYLVLSPTAGVVLGPGLGLVDETCKRKEPFGSLHRAALLGPWATIFRAPGCSATALVFLGLEEFGRLIGRDPDPELPFHIRV